MRPAHPAQRRGPVSSPGAPAPLQARALKSPRRRCTRLCGGGLLRRRVNRKKSPSRAHTMNPTPTRALKAARLRPLRSSTPNQARAKVAASQKVLVRVSSELDAPTPENVKMHQPSLPRPVVWPDNVLLAWSLYLEGTAARPTRSLGLLGNKWESSDSSPPPAPDSLRPKKSQGLKLAAGPLCGQNHSSRSVGSNPGDLHWPGDTARTVSLEGHHD